MTKTKATTIIEQDVVDPNSPGIVAYRVGKLEDTVKEGFATMKQQFEELKEVFASKADVADHERRISRLENNITWAARIVIGAVIIAVLSLIGVTQLGG